MIGQTHIQPDCRALKVQDSQKGEHTEHFTRKKESKGKERQASLSSSKTGRLIQWVSLTYPIILKSSSITSAVAKSTRANIAAHSRTIAIFDAEGLIFIHFFVDVSTRHFSRRVGAFNRTRVKLSGVERCQIHWIVSTSFATITITYRCDDSRRCSLDRRGR